MIENIKLYLLATLALAVGGLVVALRLQGSRLHAVQVDLLQAQFSKTMDKQDSTVEAAKTKYDKALKAYHEAQDA